LKCGREVGGQGAIAHLRSRHGAVGKLDENRHLVELVSVQEIENPHKSQPKPPSREEVALVESPPPIPRRASRSQNPTTFSLVDGFVLLEDDTGGLWVAEKIR